MILSSARFLGPKPWQKAGPPACVDSVTRVWAYSARLSVPSSRSAARSQAISTSRRSSPAISHTAGLNQWRISAAAMA